MKVLVAGACAVTGRSVARSLRASKVFGADLELIGTDIDVNMYGFYEKLYDKIYVMPRGFGEEYTNLMNKIIEEEKIEAAIIAKNYTVNRGSINVCCAFAQTQLDKLLDKVWSALSFLDNNTDGGFSKGRVIDTALLKKSGQFKMINGVKTPTGWGSIIQGIVVDRPGKLRGDRTDILMFEEFGLWPNSLKAYTQADALVGQIGNQFGVRLIGGTGGESGPQMEGLRKMYYDPEIYGVLPFKHNYTQTGDYTISAFFLPAFT